MAELICIIPARAGSKGLINKNIQNLGDRPLIFYTIDAIIESGLCENKNILVSTDSIEYKNLIECNRDVSVLIRDEKLAEDDTPTSAVLLDMLRKYDDTTEFMLCQPTSPLRTSKNIQEAYALFLEDKTRPVVSITKSAKPYELFTELGDNNKLLDIIGCDKNYRRQDKKDMYYPNGAIYISTKKQYIQDVSFFTQNTAGYIMSKKESIDIDDKYDLIEASAYL
ncbi:MAG: hypothetical protein BEN19_05655 [Epulopiscium sp. Nuni2H_MBin003]|nr:MAG: hypothetical protein BEN19_05655 [Epulopiscium sp. Nuni2H_MBin003]